jgi:hypothetical protein
MLFRHFPSPTSLRARGRVPRWLAAVVFGLQFLLWGGGSILEAQSAAESLSRYSHVEEEGAKCPPMHSHLDCVICRTLNGGAGGGSAPSLALFASRDADQPVVIAETAVEQGRFSPLGSRAPPLA